MKTVDFSYGRYDGGCYSVLCLAAPNGALYHANNFGEQESLDRLSWPEGVTILWRESAGAGRWRHQKYTVIVPDDWAIWTYIPKLDVPAWPELSMSAALQRFRAETNPNVDEVDFKKFLFTFFRWDFRRLERADALLRAQNLRVSQVTCYRRFNRYDWPAIHVTDTTGNQTVLERDQYMAIGSVTPNIHIVDSRHVPGYRGGDYIVAIAHPPGWTVTVEERLI